MGQLSRPEHRVMQVNGKYLDITTLTQCFTHVKKLVAHKNTQHMQTECGIVGLMTNSRSKVTPLGVVSQRTGLSINYVVNPSGAI